MTIWSPDLSAFSGPKYLALADALAASIASGALTAGTQLPTHRDLAHRLEVTVGTVSRGYAEALRRGLVTGEVGRGTFVSAPLASRTLGNWLCVPQYSDPEILALHLNTPTADDCEAEVRDALREVAGCEDLAPLLHYQHSAGVDAHRAAGVRWLRHVGLAVDRDEVVVAAGGQHAILMVFSALMEPGDVVLTEALVYQGVANAARMLNLRLAGVPMDEFGVIPDEFEAACVRHHPKAIYLTPSFQNPTAAVMPESRRREIAAIAMHHGVAVVEDDIYAFYAEQSLPTITSMVGSLGLFLSSMSKSIAPALRIAFVSAPREKIRALTDSAWSSTIMASPLMGAAATVMIENGSCERIFTRRREVARRRQALVSERLGEFVAKGSDRRCGHVWLDLPEPWRLSEFVAAAQARKVAIAPADMFAVGRGSVPHAFRLSLVAVQDEDRLIGGLDALAELLRGSPAPRRASL